MLAATNAFGDTPIPFPLSLVTRPIVGGAAARLFFSRPALRAMCRFGARRGRVDAASAVGDRSQAGTIALIFRESLRRLPELYAPIQASLPLVSVPSTVLWGTRDPFFGPGEGQRLAAAIPGADLVISEGCGHFLPDEDPRALADAILRVRAVA